MVITELPQSLKSSNSMTTEFEFRLPRGLVDSAGMMHRNGVMRLATARDEMVVGRDRRVRDYPDYGVLVLLSQVIIQLGTLSIVTPELLENLFTQDLAYLRELYNQINQQGHTQVSTNCPHCEQKLSVDLALAGE